MISEYTEYLHILKDVAQHMRITWLRKIYVIYLQVSHIALPITTYKRSTFYLSDNLHLDVYKYYTSLFLRLDLYKDNIYLFP